MCPRMLSRRRAPSSAVLASAVLLCALGVPGTAALAATGESATPGSGGGASTQTLRVAATVTVPVVEREPLVVDYRPPIVRPVDGAPLTDGFGPRIAPTAGASTEHAGVDFGAPLGTPVLAAAPGVVRGTTADVGGCGVSVTIDHVVLGERFTTVYCHLGTGTVAVEPGARVMHGDTIAGVGSTGISTGPHLHFEVRDAAGAATDPLQLLARAH